MSITFSLTIIKGGEVGRTFRVDRPSAAMGRHSGQNDIVLDDPYISSKHAKVVFNSGRFFLEDLGSTNKTFVNGVALVPGKAVALSDGMEFTLGKTGFRFSCKPTLTSAPAEKKKAPKPAGFKDKVEQMLLKSGKHKLLRYTPVLLGIALWAIVMAIFWFVTMTL